MSFKFIIFDLETTGLGKSTEICQIAAVNALSDDGHESDFNVYVMPQYDISPGASQVNQLTRSNDGLYFRGEIVDALKPAHAFNRFMDWINESKSSPDDKVILIAHNAFRFDAPVLINNMLKAGMYCDAIFGFADTLVSFKKLFPELEAYNLKYLMKKFGIVEDQTHEGLQDAKDLREVITRALEVKEVTFEDLVMEGFKEIDEIDLV